MHRIPELLCGLLILLLPLIGGTASPWLIGIAAGVTILSLCLPWRGRTITVTRTDILAGAVLMAGVLSLIFVRQGEADPAIAGRWALCSLFYIAVRLADSHTILPSAIGIAAVIQTIIMFGQAEGWLASRHLYHDLTGSFTNPGPLGGFLAVSAVACAGLALYYYNLKQKIGFWLILPAFAVIAAGIITSGSRAALLAGIVGILYLSIAFTRQHLLRFFPLIMAGLVIAGALLLYNRKKESADGRLFVWQISAKMAAGTPIYGQGIGSFPERYMFRQADYFATHPDSPAAKVADNVVYPFNESLKLLCEQGVAGGVLMLLLLFSAWTGPPVSRTAISYRAMLWAWLVFACFSYPSEVLPLAVLFAVLVAGSGGKPVRTFRITLWTRIAEILLIVVIAGAGIRCMTSLRLEAFGQRNLRYEAKQLMMRATATDLPELERLARNMVPSRISARYGLFRILIREDKTDSATLTAREIIALPVKAGNTAALRIRAELQRFLQEQDTSPTFVPVE